MKLSSVTQHFLVSHKFFVYSQTMDRRYKGASSFKTDRVISCNSITDYRVNKLLEKYALNLVKARERKILRERQTIHSFHRNNNFKKFPEENMNNINSNSEVKRFKLSDDGEVLNGYVYNNNRNTDVKDIFATVNNVHINSSHKNVNERPYDVDYRDCSKSTPKFPDNYKDFLINLDEKSDTGIDFRYTDDEDLGDDRNIKSHAKKIFAEKSTYCRPFFNLYNKEFIFDTIERNVKLQHIVKKIIIARHKEKKKEEWNNYINELKNKHDYYSTEPRYITPQYVPEETYNAELINGYYKTPKQTNDLLNDFYSSYNNIYSHNQKYNRRESEKKCSPNLDYGQYVYENEPYCYPTSSQGRYMMLKKERKMNNADKFYRLPLHRGLHRHCILIERDRTQNTQETNKTDVPIGSHISLVETSTETSNKIAKHTQIQTDLVLGVAKESKQVQLGETIKEKYEKVSQNVDRLKEKIQMNEQNLKRKSSMQAISSKVDALVLSINTLMEELRTKRNVFPNNKSIHCKLSNSNRLSVGKSDTLELFNAKQYFCNVMTNCSGSAIPKLQTRKYISTEIDNILHEELDKSDKLRKDIENMVKTETKPCAVQISFEIPTKEISTEVTASLSRGKFAKIDERITVEELISRTEDRMTIAVNTDPLGLTALLRISSDTIKKILSYVPNVDYSWYISRIQLPKMSNELMYHYVCKICSAAFDRPSQLSDHIQRHILGHTKDCCVCRHVIDDKRVSGLFTCQYCGNRFTRAYCCELHQQCCSKRLGRCHNGPSSLMLLK